MLASFGGGEECLCNGLWLFQRISGLFFIPFYSVLFGQFHNSVIKEIAEASPEPALSELLWYRNV